ncbi:deda family protein [hydrocarbon metagenome]|uniref:Deda family protein n=1 Tax=hydrocarbon metagenome TaxID=938273 RepID=A0A0W8G0R3_9ZZZZ
MYYVGKLFGEKLIRRGKIKFIKHGDILKADRWFRKWGYKLILANRFLPGTRSVISFFSGVHELDVGRTFVFSAISAFAWNAFIIYLGMVVGHNVELIDYYLNTYSYAIIALTIAVIAVILIRIFWRKKKEN